ncbi:MAG: DUF2845 domain-containing protein [Lysobacterales bacterium]|nr:MAG: DUF2845 domain-containing protein [Xanthomonadales bacterium]
MAIERRAVTLVALAAAATPAAADTMRCGSRLISDGDAMEQVLESCGEPAERTRTWIQRQPRFEYGGREIPFEGREDVPVDVWTYDFGSSKLKRRVRFVAGKVQSIETLEHGSNR